jgi:hypothetical protein
MVKAISGEEALQRLAGADFAVAILDIRLPGMRQAAVSLLRLVTIWSRCLRLLFVLDVGRSPAVAAACLPFLDQASESGGQLAGIGRPLLRSRGEARRQQLDLLSWQAPFLHQVPPVGRDTEQRGVAADKLEPDDAQGMPIIPRVGRLSTDLLRRGVQGRVHPPNDRGQRQAAAAAGISQVLGSQAADAEVRHQRRVPLALPSPNQDV